ncbi:MAG: hypothetical protein M1826_005612 [Phylliscum demangeonii]|nr:MAG: hypothetical protein M1826_005612 [Phylliscum demangeonii]
MTPEDAEVEEGLIPFIRGDFDFPSMRNAAFNNFAPFLAHPTVDPRPDLFDGADPATINPRVRRDLGIDVTVTIKDKDQVERTTVVRKSYIIPCRTPSYPALPTFFLEAKGPAAVARLQACYNGVLGARAMLKLRNYARGCDEDPVLSAMPPPSPTFSLSSSALGTPALAGLSADDANVSHHAEPPQLPLSPSAPLDDADASDDIG